LSGAGLADERVDCFEGDRRKLRDELPGQLLRCARRIPPKGLAQNGRGIKRAARRFGEFLHWLTARIRALCAFARRTRILGSYFQRAAVARQAWAPCGPCRNFFCRVGRAPQHLSLLLFALLSGCEVICRSANASARHIHSYRQDSADRVRTRHLWSGPH
jgi:hypothetical protein